MDDVDDNTLADATRRYVSLRRRYWRSFLGFVLSGMLGVLLALGFLSCWAVVYLTQISILNFRCPRCDKRFIVSWWVAWPTAACKHCGLYLG